MFGYDFVTLDEEQKHRRREQLDFFAVSGLMSVLVVLCAFQVSYFLSWLSREILDSGRPSSPSFNKRSDGKEWIRKSRQRCEQIRWWMKKDVISGWGIGTRAEWTGGAIWATWLLFLCVVQTGNDYLHLTKRFGIIGASQLPLHYLLAMRSPFSPVQFLTRMSHEELKGAHQVLGRIIFFLFVLHAGFYLNFFVRAGVLTKRIQEKDVIFGLLSLTLFWILSTTALKQLRRWNYRVFYMSHVAIASLVLPMLWIHVHHVRLYVYIVLIVYILHLLLRIFSMDRYPGSIRILPGTNLIEIRIPLTLDSLKADNLALEWKPGQHVYLSRPNVRSDSTLYEQFVLRNKTNPFTIASIPIKDKELVLIARTLKGNTKHLAHLARLLSASGNELAKLPLDLEGPYGAAANLPDFTAYNKILLVAGGVGATFIMPIYRSILDASASSEEAYIAPSQIRFIWATRKLAETQWAFPSDRNGRAASEDEHKVEVYVTQPQGPDLHAGDAGEDVELVEEDQLLSVEEQMERPRKGMVLKAGRPKMQAIVDEELSKASKVAVIACGPKGLINTLSESVEPWISRGVDVYWHDETFGW